MVVLVIFSRFKVVFQVVDLPLGLVVFIYLPIIIAL